MLNISMATDLERQAEGIRRKLDKLSDEEIRLRLDTRAISVPLHKSVAEALLEERERERKKTGEVARLRDEISTLKGELRDKATELRLTRIGLFIAAAAFVADLIFR